MQILKQLALYSIFILLNQFVVASPSIGLGYTPKYPDNFQYFDYVNPDAPKGGKIILPGFGNFDSFNPYILKGVSVDGLSELVFETLMVQSADEPYSLYGHIAHDIKLAKNKRAVTFKLNPQARFSDGSPILAQDVKVSFDTIKSEKGHPSYRFYWADIQQAVIVNKRTIRFDFVRVNPELHLIAAQIPVFSHKWVNGESFDKLSRKKPIGSGPYTIGKYSLGKNITYMRDPNYWAKNLPTRRGMFNFDEIIYKYYKDSTVMLEALKAGEFDYTLVNHSKQWARDYVGEKFDSKQIIKEELKHKNNAGMQGFVFNTRRPLFKDKRVRRALTLAFDFSWSNSMLFYNQYTRCDSYFSNSELASKGLPEGKELELLNRYRSELPSEVFTKVWLPPSTENKGDLRNNLITAAALLKEAGWFVKEGVLHNKEGKRFEFDVLLAQKGFERILAPYAYNLRKLGIILHYRTVDVSLYIRRNRTFDFDLMVASYPQSQSPGNELYNLWHSSSANEEGSRNLIGINNKVVDKLIEHVVFAKNREELIVAARALDRVLLHQEYLIPNWYIAVHRIAYWDKFTYPKKLPLYFSADNWVLSTWWNK
ncbi:MAG: extracellular solute-binding protein [Gammaproteobacteria bacterium]|nr:extracellular solute-binding protein [Gammaproteobacteria bacterium]